MHGPHWSLLLLHLSPHQHGKLTLENRVAEQGRILPEHHESLELLRVEQTRHWAHHWWLWQAGRLKLL